LTSWLHFLLHDENPDRCGVFERPPSGCWRPRVVKVLAPTRATVGYGIKFAAVGLSDIVTTNRGQRGGAIRLTGDLRRGRPSIPTSKRDRASTVRPARGCGARRHGPPRGCSHALREQAGRPP